MADNFYLFHSTVATHKHWYWALDTKVCVGYYSLPNMVIPFTFIKHQKWLFFLFYWLWNYEIILSLSFTMFYTGNPS